VVASLLDKVPNLAGLARTCEVFRARALALPDLAVANDPLFASISVTAGVCAREGGEEGRGGSWGARALHAGRALRRVDHALQGGALQRAA
jgi:hypothetical protein